MKRLMRTMVLTAVIAMGLTVHSATTYYGLFVGVNDYMSAPGNYLKGCDWDAMRMMDAYTRGGFCASGNAEMIANFSATKEVVRAKFSVLAGKAVAGDTVLYYQSSHGGDYNNDKGSYLCMTDEHWTDEEFADDLAQFADGVQVIVVLDACYSGGMFKSAKGVAKKNAKWDFVSHVQSHLDARRAAAKTARAKGVPSVAWITAADWNEESWMDEATGVRGSEFTHAVLAGWEDGSADKDGDHFVSFGELAEYAKAKVPRSSVQSENDALLAATRAGQSYDVATFRLLSADNTLYGYLGECPASVVVPAGTELIADGVFEGCKTLMSVTIPTNVCYIGAAAFQECTSLKNVTITPRAEGNPLAIAEGWYYCNEWYDDEAGEQVQDTELSGVFAGCTALESFDFSGIEYVGAAAFVGCTSLKDVTIPASAYYIGEGAFQNCTGLKSVTIEPRDEDELLEMADGEYYFYEWYDVEAGKAVWERESCGVFAGCTSLESFDFSGVAYVADAAFVDCTSLTTITIPTNVWSIGESAFQNCTGLKSVIIEPRGEDNPLDIAGGNFFYDRWFDEEFGMYVWEREIYGVFAGCTSLEYLALSGVEYIGSSLFTGCDSLKTVEFDETLFEIGGYAFYGQEALTSVTIPASVYYIGESAFQNCTGLKSVVIEPRGEGNPLELADGYYYCYESSDYLYACDEPSYCYVSYDGEGYDGYEYFDKDESELSGVFAGCTSLESFDFSGIEYVGAAAFVGCTSLRDVTIPASVYCIGESAFQNCTGLKSVTIEPRDEDNPLEIAEGDYYYDEWYSAEAAQLFWERELSGVFAGCTSLENLALSGIESIEAATFVGCTSLKEVTIPASVYYIGEYAFANCTALANVIYESGARNVEIEDTAFAGCPYADVFGLDIVDNCVVGFHGLCPAAVVIPEGVTNIAECAFSWWAYCREAEVCDEVEDDWYGHETCSLVNLTSVTLPASVASVGEWAFEDCVSLVTVLAGNPGILIDGSAFTGCEKLTINVEKVGHTLVGWDLSREKNPQKWVGNHWDEELGRWIDDYEEYEPDVIPVGSVVRVGDIKPLVYGMPTDKTSLAWNPETGEFDLEIVVTNYLDGVWATPAWEVNKYTLKFDTDGGSEVAPITQDYGTTVTPPAAPAKAGYTFAGWNPAVPEKMPVENMTLTARWAANRYTVTFDPNGGTGTMPTQEFLYDSEQLLAGCSFEYAAHDFLGWSLVADSEDIAYFDGENVLNLTALSGGNVTLYAVWERTSLWAPVGGRTPAGAGVGAFGSGDALLTGTAAESYDGYVQDADGRIVGTMQMTVAKAKINKKSQKSLSKVIATIQLVGEKKQTVKGDLDIETGTFEQVDKTGRKLSLVLGANGLSGTYGPYIIDGAQNKFKSKNAAAKAKGAKALAKWQKTWSVAWPGADGWNGMSLTVAAKGKVKIAGMLANGTKVSATSQLLVGEGDVCVIPVIVTKKARIAFNLWLSDDGVEVVGLEDAVAGKVDELNAGAAFALDAAAFAAMWGRVALPYLPNGASVVQEGKKWVVASGAKAGKVVYQKGTTDVDEASLGENPSGLKLTYTAKTGTFKGSFKAYVDVNGKPKATTVNVTGVLVDGVGYGTATIKGVGGVPVTVE